MSARRCLSAGLALATLGVMAPSAVAADVVSPSDGETVGSRPVFVFDFASGSAEIELSRSPEVRGAGPDVGAFVERATGHSMLFGTLGRPPGTAPWGNRPIAAGRYFWHAKLNDHATEQERGFAEPSWGPIRTLTVRDEAPLFEGWVIRARRAQRTRACASRYVLSGTIAFSDNEETPRVTYTLSYRWAGRTLGRSRGSLSFGGRFSQAVCTRRSQIWVTPSLSDDAGHLVRGPKRLVRIR